LAIEGLSAFLIFWGLVSSTQIIEHGHSLLEMGLGTVGIPHGHFLNQPGSGAPAPPSIPRRSLPGAKQRCVSDHESENLSLNNMPETVKRLVEHRLLSANFADPSQVSLETLHLVQRSFFDGVSGSFPSWVSFVDIGE
jgi:hypothetical protein